MEKESLGIHSEYACHDVYGALNMPVYHTLAYEFKDAKSMSDAFCGRTDVPDYSRITNPTVINRLLEGRYIRKVAKFRTHPESPEHVREQ